MGGDDGVAIGGTLVCYLVGVAAALDVAAEGQSIAINGEDIGDFDKGELGPVGLVSREVESERSLSGLTT